MGEPDDKVVVSVDIQESDLLRENFWFHYSKWSIRLMVIVLFTAPIYGLWVLPEVNYPNPLGVVVALAPLLFLVAFISTIWLQTKRAYSSLKGFQKNIRYAFSTDGYDVRDEKSSAHISWDSVHKAIETNRSFNIFFHKSFFHVVPKRCIQQQTDVARLREILKQSLGDKAKVDGLIGQRTG